VLPALPPLASTIVPSNSRAGDAAAGEARPVECQQPAVPSAGVAPDDPARAAALPCLLAALAAVPPDVPDFVSAVAQVMDLAARPGQLVVPASLLAELRAILRVTLIPQDPAATAQALRRAVQDGGSLFEARIARALAAAADQRTPAPPAGDARTLLGAMLTLLANKVPRRQPNGAERAVLPDGSLAAAGLLTEAVERVGGALLAQQLETAARAQAAGVWRVDVPFEFGGRRAALACEFEPDRERQGRRADGSACGRLHVLVTPEGASALEVRFSWGAGSLAVDVYVESDGRATALAAGREILVDRLRTAGFARASVDIWANPARIARWATRRAATSTAGRVLDTSA